MAPKGGLGQLSIEGDVEDVSSCLPWKVNTILADRDKSLHTNPLFQLLISKYIYITAMSETRYQ